MIKEETLRQLFFRQLEILDSNQEECFIILQVYENLLIWNYFELVIWVQYM